MSAPLSAADIDEAAQRISGVVLRSPLQYSERLSEATGATVYLKREDLQAVRSYKLRGAHNLLMQLSEDEKAAWWERAVEAWPDYAEYQTKTDREIPVFVLTPIN